MVHMHASANLLFNTQISAISFSIHCVLSSFPILSYCSNARSVIQLEISFLTKAPLTIDWKNWLDIMTTKAGNSLYCYTPTGREVYVLAFEIIYTGVRWLL